MDLDAYSAANSAEWSRLDELARRRSLSGAEADELIELYQASATHLSAIRTTAGRAPHGERLSVALARARLRFTGAAPNVLRQATVFFSLQLPAALYRVRWASAVTAAVTVVIAALSAVWASDPVVMAALGPRDELRELAEQEFVAYYSEHPEGSFAGQVWTNNAWIAAQCIAFGITGLWVPYVIMQNAVGLGVTAAVMNEFDRLDHFFLYIAPHGQLELYSVFVAAAAGIMIFWSWVSPGARSRSAALAEDGRALFAIVVGLILALLVSGIIEGYVTRQDWPWPIKIGIGTAALAGFLAYQWLVGRRAHRAGHSGDLDEFEAGARQLVGG